MYNRLEELRGKKVLVFGAGGGGDVLGAYILYTKLRSLGADPVIGSVVWERYVIDPVPGPIPLEATEGVIKSWGGAALVDGSLVAYREGRRVKPQLSRLLEATGLEGLYIDLSKGAEGVYRGVKNAMEDLGIEVVIGLDTGGDIIARGCEDGLRSPLADAISLNVLARLNGLLAILGPGADGELEDLQVLEYIAKIASNNGLIGIYGLNKIEFNTALGVADAVVSEASKIPLKGFQGFYGVARIRGGTRKVRVSPVSATIYILDPAKASDHTPLPQLVGGTRSIEEARRRLNSRCIYTELDLEEDLYQMKPGSTSRPMSIDEIYHEGRRRLLMEGCKPNC